MAKLTTNQQLMREQAFQTARLANATEKLVLEHRFANDLLLRRLAASGHGANIMAETRREQASERDELDHDHVAILSAYSDESDVDQDQPEPETDDQDG